VVGCDRLVLDRCMVLEAAAGRDRGRAATADRGRGVAGRASAWHVSGGKTKYKIVECNGKTQNVM
jgi:hypothetical protein